ncbi:MAG: hypothetical protein BMS9Abin29_1673 [Gemmatimonadota bacterium]|nr:MAG: hypothetical protein BMS9Abin29_1673 [Gemmatimonadota bacterium]
MSTTSPNPESHRLLRIFLLAALIAAGVPGSAFAQVNADSNQIRVGVTLGGIGLVGVAVEFRSGDNSIDVNLATFTFHDASVSVVGKRYFGAGDARPFVGAGLWGVLGRQESSSGKVLLLRAPVGLDWRVTGNHFLGGAISVNKALAVKRSDPDDDTPMSGRPIPLPGFYYRWQN